MATRKTRKNKRASKLASMKGWTFKSGGRFLLDGDGDLFVYTRKADAEYILEYPPYQEPYSEDTAVARVEVRELG